MASVYNRSGKPYLYVNAALASNAWTEVSFGAYSQSIWMQSVTQATKISFDGGTTSFTCATTATVPFLRLDVRASSVWLQAATATSNVTLLAAVEPGSA